MLGIDLNVHSYLNKFSEVLASIDHHEIQAWSDALYDAWEGDKFVYFIGNGGSGTSATHMAEDLGKSTLSAEKLADDRSQRLKALSLTDNVGWIMAIANDLDYSEIFVQQLKNFGREGDVLVAISGSGNSKNIVKAVEWANTKGIITIGVTGYDGGKVKEISKLGVHVPIADMGMVESMHLSVFHWVLNDIYARINKEGRHQ